MPEGPPSRQRPDPSRRPGPGLSRAPADDDASERYTVLCELARGGLGRVLAATDDALGRDVAIKEVLAPSPEAHARFEREARLTARLQHSGVVPVYDVGRWPSGEPFFVMKKVEGRSLASLITEARAPEERLALLPRVLAVADTVAYAHSCGIIHRDLKPSNVVVSRYGETVVVDWGLAKLITEADELSGDPTSLDLPGGLTQVGRILGTPGFMPPEQARGERVDERADVHALGGILHNVLAGQPPSPGAVASLRDRIPAVPGDLLAIVDKAMAPDAAARYATAGALAQDLRRYLDGQLVLAHRYSPSALLARWLRRHRLTVMVAGVLLAALVVSAVAAVTRIVAERNAAVEAHRLAESRENALVLMQSQRVLTEEPTAALAWLKRYRGPADQAWLRAAVAEEAVALGVARHIFQFDVPAQAVEVSPVAPLMATGASDGVVRLFDLESGARRALPAHPAPITHLAFSPADGGLVSGDVRGNLRFWTAEGELRQELPLGPGQISRLLFTPDGKALAVAVGMNRVTMVQPGPAPAKSVSFALDARLSALELCAAGGPLLVTTVDGRALALDRGAERPRTLAGTHPDARLHCLPGGNQFVSAGVDGVVRLWDVRAGALRELGRHDDWVTSIASSPDGRLIATGSGDDTVRLFPVLGGRPRLLRGHADTVRDLVFSPSGDWLASVSYDSTVRVWDVATGEVAREYRETRLGTTRLALTAGGGHLVASGLYQARVWPVERLPVRTLRGHAGVVTDLAWSTDGRLLASASRDQRVRTWDLATGATWTSGNLGSWTLGVEFMGPTSLRVGTRTGGTFLFDLAAGDRTQLTAPDSAYEQTITGPGHLAYPQGGPAGAMVVKTLATGLTVTLEGVVPQSVDDLRFTADGKRALLATQDGLVGLWSTETGRAEKRHQLNERISDLALSSDQRWGVLLSERSRLLRWEIDRDQLVVVPSDGVRGDELFFLPDQRTLAYKAWDGTLRLVDVVSFATKVLRGHRTRIVELARARSRPSLIATSDFNGFVRLWDLQTQETAVLHARAGVVENMAFSPDGHFLATSGQDALVRVWDLRSLPLARPDARDLAWLQGRTTVAVNDGRGLLTP